MSKDKRIPELLTPGEVADQFGVTTMTVARWVERRQLRAAFTLPSGHRRFRRDDVDAFAATYSPEVPS